MKTSHLFAYLVVLCVALVSTTAFVQKPAVSHTFAGRVNSKTLPLQMGFFGGDEEPKQLTRENEPDDYFRT
jgi:hypothetical protein